MSLLIQKPNQTEKFENGQRKDGQPLNGHGRPPIRYAPHDGKAVSEDEYWERYYEHGHVEGDASYEWNNGILEAKPMASRRQAQLYNWFFEILCHFLKVHPVALMMNLEIGFRMEIDDPKHPGEKKKSTRKPDIGIIGNDNPIPWLDEERSYRGICDMVIESLSDSDRGEIDRDTVTKKAEYEAAGVREYFILDPSEENQYFYRLGAERRYAEILSDNDIVRSEVLAGFQFRLSDLIRQPTLEEMATDDVYKAFILPAYQAALQQAEEADARAEEERLRAEEERLRAEEEHRRAEEERLRAEEEHRRAEEERLRADSANERVELLEAKMRELGIDDPDL